MKRNEPKFVGASHNDRSSGLTDSDQNGGSSQLERADQLELAGRLEGADEPEFSQHEALSSIFFDGELSDDDDFSSSDIAACLASEEFNTDISDFKLIRTGVRDWYRGVEQEILARDPNGDSLWAKLEGELVKELAGQSAAKAGDIDSTKIDSARRQALTERAEKFVAEVSESSKGNLGGAGYPGSNISGRSKRQSGWTWREYMAWGSSVGVAAMLVLIFANPSAPVSNSSNSQFSNRQSSNQDLASQTGLASNGGVVSNGRVEVVARGDNQPSVISGLQAVSDQGGNPESFIQNVSTGGSINPGGLSARELQIDRVLQRARLATVLRTDGADIEWIRSDHGFNLVPSVNGKAPPAIWIARSTAPH